MGGPRGCCRLPATAARLPRAGRPVVHGRLRGEDGAGRGMHDLRSVAVYRRYQAAPVAPPLGPEHGRRSLSRQHRQGWPFEDMPAAGQLPAGCRCRLIEAGQREREPHLGRTAAPLGQGPAGAQGPFLARIGQQRRLRVVAGRPRYPGGIATPRKIAGPTARQLPAVQLFRNRRIA